MSPTTISPVPRVNIPDPCDAKLDAIMLGRKPNPQLHELRFRFDIITVKCHLCFCQVLGGRPLLLVGITCGQSQIWDIMLQ